MIMADFRRLLEDLEIDVRDYSGRGMGGAECIGFVCEFERLPYTVAQIVTEAPDPDAAKRLWTNHTPNGSRTTGGDSPS